MMGRSGRERGSGAGRDSSLRANTQVDMDSLLNGRLMMPGLAGCSQNHSSVCCSAAVTPHSPPCLAETERLLAKIPDALMTISLLALVSVRGERRWIVPFTRK